MFWLGLIGLIGGGIGEILSLALIFLSGRGILNNSVVPIPPNIARDTPTIFINTLPSQIPSPTIPSLATNTILATEAKQAATDTPIPPTMTVTSAAQNNFNDTFSNINSGWGEQHDQVFDKGYFQTSTYRMGIKAPQQLLIAISPDNLAKPIQNIVISVRGRQNLPGVGAFGVICRMQDEQNYYSAMISGDQFRIGKMINGNYTSLTDPAWQPLPDTVTDQDGYDTIDFSCIDSFIVLQVNGIGAAHVTDDNLTQGAVGLIAIAGKDQGKDGYYTLAFFDDFSVYIP